MSPMPRKRFLCCIPVEGTVTALGYFQASIAVAGILIVLRAIVILFYDFISFTTDSYSYTYNDLTFIKDLSWTLLILGLCLTLAVFLLVGIEKRRAGCVLTFLVGGALGTLALTIYTVVTISTRPRTWLDFSIVRHIAIEIFLVITVYSLGLVMVYFVYRNIKLERNCNNMIYNVLQENNCNVKNFREEDVA